ncbi:MAG: helix-turn-helix transcriptional regulator [Acidobacteria bacterium]|nr:helix-turn-helix transcriptional regulator [Acidobacteriota bacterium]
MNNVKTAHFGRPLSSIVPEIGAKLTELAHEALRTKEHLKGLKFTARVPFEHGPLREWLAGFFPIDLGGGVAGVAHTLVEVTDQSRVEAVLADLALGLTEPIPRGGLTAREADVLALIGHGKTTKEIAVLLAISAETVGNHRKQLCRKLSVHLTGCSPLVS